MITWVVYLGIGLVIGITAGIFLSRLDMLKSKKQQQLEEDLEKTRTELDNYRTEVARHFVQTSSLINNMTESYRAVFDHLASGAQELCGDRLATHLLDLPKTRMLEQAELARETEDVNVSREAISDIEAAAEPVDEHADMTETEVAAEAVTNPEPEASTEAKPAPPKKAGSEEKNRTGGKAKAADKRRSGNPDSDDDDEHAAFAGEQGIPAEVAAAVGTEETPAVDTGEKQPTVH